MSWLSNYVLPKIRVFRGRDVPDNLWRKCPSCEQMLFHRELAANFEVCRHCGHHFRIGGAAFSDKHANWIVNADHATCSDVLELAAIARDEVAARTGVTLEMEVKVIGHD